MVLFTFYEMEEPNPGGSPFQGFRQGDVEEAAELKYKFGMVRIKGLEELVEKLVARVAVLEGERVMWKVQMEEFEKKWIGRAQSLESELSEVKKEKESLKEENKSLKKEMREVKKCEEDMQTTIKKVEKKQCEWVKLNEENEQSLMQIIEHQKKEKEEMEKKIVNVIKEKKKMVRDTVDKVKCVVLFGVKEENIVDRLERDRKEKEKIRQIVTEVVEDEDRAMGQVEEYYRIGKFEENKDRPLKIKFATQLQAEEMVNGAWKLARKDVWKKVWINRDLDEEERIKQRELVGEAKEKNDNRTEEEKKKFYWKAVDLRIRKKYYKK